MMGAIKELLEDLPENARWDDDDLLVFLTPDQLEREAASVSFEDWGADR